MSPVFDQDGSSEQVPARTTHSWRRLFGRWLIRATSALGILLLLVLLTPITNAWALYLAGPWQNATGDVLVVPGAEDMGTGILGYSSYIRSYYALRAWREGNFKRVLLLGKDVAEPMRQFLLQHGVPPEAVLAENESRNTWENALAAKRLLQQGERPVLMSSDYHMRRAGCAFTKAGLRPAVVPCPDAIKRATRIWSRPEVAATLFTESSKLVGYYLEGRC